MSDSSSASANKRPASPLQDGNAAKRAREDPSSSSPTKAAPVSPDDDKAKRKMDDADSKSYVPSNALGSSLSTASNEAGPSTSTISAPPLPATPAKPSSDSPAQQISMRALIVTQDASIIIGRAGAHVNEIRVGSKLSYSADQTRTSRVHV